MLTDPAGTLSLPIEARTQALLIYVGLSQILVTKYFTEHSLKQLN